MKVTISRFEYSGLLGCAFLVWLKILVNIKMPPHSAPLSDRIAMVAWGLVAFGAMLWLAAATLQHFLLWALAAKRKLDAEP